MTERMVERGGNDLLRADEYLARVGMKAIPTPQGTMNQQARCPLAAQAGSLCSTEQLKEVSSMDNLLKIIERAGNGLLQADEYLARVGVRAIPTPPAT